MFGFKRRHEEIMNAFKALNFVLEQTLCKLNDVEKLQEPLSDVTKELNETVIDNGQRLNTMINELKGACAMARASLPKREDINEIKRKPGRPKRKV